MTTLLHLDASARPGRSGENPYGSHTRRLTHRFVSRWLAAQPQARVIERDVGLAPPQPVTGAWIHAAFTAEEKREPWMRDTLAQSDRLIDELLQADVLVLGVPMYNFGVPAQFKAYIDNIVRVGRTFGFDRSRPQPYWPMLAGLGKRVALLSSRGDHGYDDPARLAHMNHVEPSVRTALNYIGITAIRTACAEYDEYGDARLAASIAAAEARVDQLADAMLAEAAAAEPRAARA